MNFRQKYCRNCKTPLKWNGGHFCSKECKEAYAKNPPKPVLTGSHSEKGLATISQMGTVPTDWAFVEIKWVKELRVVPTKETCTACHGHKYQYIREVNGKWETMSSSAMSEASNKANGQYSNSSWYAQNNGYRISYHCDACGDRGYKWVAKERMVMIGYPQWSKETLFDSRFGNGNGGSTCGLCGKFVMKTNLYPVTAKGADGRIHGMWVGMDCAKKFFGLKNFKKDEENQFFAKGLEEEVKEGK